jgi:uncharacterized protein YjbJ (UPF0337 family)
VLRVARAAAEAPGTARPVPAPSASDRRRSGGPASPALARAMALAEASGGSLTVDEAGRPTVELAPSRPALARAPWDEVAGTVGSLRSQAQQAQGTVRQAVGSARGYADRARTGAQEAWTEARQAASDAEARAGATVAGAESAARGALGSAESAARDALGQAGDAARGALGSAEQAARGALRGLPGAAGAGAMPDLDDMYDRLVERLRREILAEMERAGGAVRGLGT